jgi:hypothetical protein
VWHHGQTVACENSLGRRRSHDYGEYRTVALGRTIEGVGGMLGTRYLESQAVGMTDLELPMHFGGDCLRN